MPPGDQGWHIRTMKKLIRQGSAHPRDGGPDDCRSQENHHMTHPSEGEISADVPFDQPGDEQGFPRIAESEGAGGPDGSVASEIGYDRCCYDTDGHGPS